MMKTALPFFAASLLICIGAVVSYLVWYGMVSNTSAHATELASLIQARTVESAQIVSAKKTLAALADEGIVFDDYFVSEEGVVPFLERLESTGSSLGASVKVLSVSTETGGGRARLLLNVQIDGTFNSVLRTLGTIEYGPYDLRTLTLSLNKTGETETSGTTWSATATFSVGAQSAHTPAVKVPPASAI